MKKMITLVLAVVLCAAFAVPALGADYSFGSGPDTASTFGRPTGYDAPVTPNPLTENTRRNKDNSALPPPYFYGSGFIPTEPSSLYHDNLPTSGFVPAGQNLPPVGNEAYAPGSANVEANVSGGFLPTTSQTATLNIAPWLYENGSVGTIYVHRFNRTVTVWPGETVENMNRGAGHFSFTSAWDGNVGLAAHNRGSASYFSFVKDLNTGDRITYTTRYGTRVYEVFRKDRIQETDNSPLNWSAENILTLITCVENVPSQRWVAQLREVR